MELNEILWWVILICESFNIWLDLVMLHIKAISKPLLALFSLDLNNYVNAHFGFSDIEEKQLIDLRESQLLYKLSDEVHASNMFHLSFFLDQLLLSCGYVWFFML